MLEHGSIGGTMQERTSRSQVPFHGHLLGLLNLSRNVMSS